MRFPDVEGEATPRSGTPRGVLSRALNVSVASG